MAFATVAKFGGVDDLHQLAARWPERPWFDDAAWLSAFELLVLSVRMARWPCPDEGCGGGAIAIGTSSSVQELSRTWPSQIVRVGGGVVEDCRTSWLRTDSRNQLLLGRIALTRLAELDTIRAKATNATVTRSNRNNEKNIPLGRYGVPSEFGSAAVFLFSNARITLAPRFRWTVLIKHIF